MNAVECSGIKCYSHVYSHYTYLPFRWASQKKKKGVLTVLKDKANVANASNEVNIHGY